MAHKVNLNSYSPEHQRLLIDAMIANGAITITRCPDGARTNLDPRRGGGMLPRHLDPRVLDDTREGEPA